MAATFAAFVENVAEQRVWKGQLRLVERLLTRMANRSAALSFDRWCEATEEAARGRLVIARTLAKMSRRNLQAAFAGWASKTAAAASGRAAADRVVRRLLHRNIDRAWRRWSTYTQNQTWAAAVAHRRGASKDTALLQAVLRAWREAHSERRALFARFLRPPSRAAKLASYFSTWCVHAGALRRDAHLVGLYTLKSVEPYIGCKRLVTTLAPMK